MVKDNIDIIIIRKGNNFIIQGLELSFLNRLKLLIWRKNNQIVLNNCKILINGKEQT